MVRLLEDKEYTLKRKLILDAAAVVMAENGFHQAKMEDIAKEAGVGKGTVYEYFDSKKDLFQELIFSTSKEYSQKIEEEIRNNSCVPDTIKQILKLHLEFLKNNPKVANIIMSEHHFIEEELRTWILEENKEKFKLMQEIIEKGAERGELQVDNPTLASHLVAGMILSTGGYYLREEHNSDIEEICDSAVKMLLKGIS